MLLPVPSTVPGMNSFLHPSTHHPSTHPPSHHPSIPPPFHPPTHPPCIQPSTHSPPTIHRLSTHPPVHPITIYPLIHHPSTHPLSHSPCTHSSTYLPTHLSLLPPTIQPFINHLPTHPSIQKTIPEYPPCSCLVPSGRTCWSKINTGGLWEAGLRKPTCFLERFQGISGQSLAPCRHPEPPPIPNIHSCSSSWWDVVPVPVLGEVPETE